MNLGEAVSKQWFPPSHFDRLAIFKAFKALLIGGESFPDDEASPQTRHNLAKKSSAGRRNKWFPPKPRCPTRHFFAQNQP